MPVTISDDAKTLLRERMEASGFERPLAWIAFAEQPPDARPPDDSDVDWTVKRRDLWALRVGEGAGIAGIDARVVMVDGLGFVCDFFPMRFDISLREGQFRIAAAA
jgi:hypothetical protein